MKPLVDTHFHLDLFKQSREEVKRIDEAGVYTIAVTNAPRVFTHTVQLCQSSKFVRPALGLHPELVQSEKNAVDLFESLSKGTKYIGEIGLDYSTSLTAERSIQRKCLERIVSGLNGKVITVHTRKAARDTTSIFGKQIHNRIIYHWFTGSPNEFEAAVTNGYYFSINGRMLKSKGGLEICKEIPAERILTESDGPFTNDSPSTIGAIIDSLAQTRKIDANELRNKVFDNFREIVTFAESYRPSS